MINNLFDKLLDSYLLEYSRTTNINSISHRLLVVDLPAEISRILNNREIYVKGSEGVGNRTDYPWVCVMNRKLTNTPQKSIYIAYLFKKNMEGFYLTLNQGITFFESTYKKNKYLHASKVANYFKNEINDNYFSKESINLGGKRGDNGYGFERTTILSKYYKKGSSSSSELIQDLLKMMDLYNEVVDLLYPDTYEKAVLRILDSPTEVMLAVEEAEKQIREVLHDSQTQPNTIQDLLEVEPNRYKIKRLAKLAAGNDRKIDYVKKALENVKTGLLGEELVLQFEKNKLIKNGFDNLLNDIKWISKQTDVFGYDIESLDVTSEGKTKKIYIEVKTTISKYDTDFYVSSNEVQKSNELGSDYWLYRIFDCNSPQPKIYKLNGRISDNFTIDPINYLARLKKI